MPSTTVRISRAGHRLLSELAAAENLSMPALLETALESYRRQQFLDRSARAFADLRSAPQAARAYDREMTGLDRAAGDGLKGLRA